MNSELEKIKKFKVPIIEHNTHMEFVFDKILIGVVKLIKFEKLDITYSISIEDDYSKIFLKTIENFKFSDCDVIFEDNSMMVLYKDFEIAELTNLVSIEQLRKYDTPSKAYFYILGQMINKNILIKEDLIGIAKETNLFQIHLWELQRKQVFGIRKVLPKDSLRNILYKNHTKERILTFENLIELLKY